MHKFRGLEPKNRWGYLRVLRLRRRNLKELDELRMKAKDEYDRLFIECDREALEIQKLEYKFIHKTK